jgi:glutamate 5-kinase
LQFFPDADLIPFVSSINRNVEKIANDIPGALGTGGMLSKIHAAKKVTAAGIPMIIARGEKTNILMRLFAGEKHGTLFVPKKKRLTSRKCWIAFSLKSKGVITIDDGASTAILKRGKSLLPSGVVDVDGEFQMGDAVSFKGKTDEILGIGLVNYSAADIRKIMGYRTSMIKDRLGDKPYDEIIHRDNLAVTAER